jgi:hypothetical protein
MLSEIEKHGYLTVTNRNTGEKEVVIRSKVDTVSGRVIEALNAQLNKLRPNYPVSEDFIFIHYYPGADDCNSTGSSTRQSIGRRNKFFSREISKRENVVEIGICKDSTGLSRWNLHRDYFSDPEGLVERTFMKHYYPCSSYIILHQSGKYYAYFGESWMKKAISDLDLFMALFEEKV